MSSTEVRLKQFKPDMKGLWKVWHEPLFFKVLQISYKVHKAHCTKEATCKNSRNFKKVLVLSLKKVSIQSKNGCCDANFRVDGPKEILEDMVRGAVTIQKIVQSLRNSIENAKKNVWNV